MSMFWRLLLGNVAVTLVVFVVLVFSPVTLTLPMDPVEVEVLVAVLGLLLLIFPAAAVALDGAAWDRIEQRAP